MTISLPAPALYAIGDISFMKMAVASTCFCWRSAEAIPCKVPWSGAVGSCAASPSIRPGTLPTSAPIDCAEASVDWASASWVRAAARASSNPWTPTAVCWTCARMGAKASTLCTDAIATLAAVIWSWKAARLSCGYCPAFASKVLAVCIEALDRDAGVLCLGQHDIPAVELALQRIPALRDLLLVDRLQIGVELIEGVELAVFGDRLLPPRRRLDGLDLGVSPG